MAISVDTMDICQPLIGLLIGFFGRQVGFWTKDSLKGLGDVIFRFTNSVMFIKCIVESTTMRIHWAMPICILLYNIITLFGGHYLFAQVPWPNNIILAMASTGLMGGSFIPWSLSFFGDIGLQYYVYQELYNVIHIFGTVFAYAFYYLKIQAPKSSQSKNVPLVIRNTISAGAEAGGGCEEGGPKHSPETWSDLGKQFLLFPGIIAFLLAWPVYFILLACDITVGESVTELFDFLTDGLDFYLLVFVGGSFTIADIIKHSQNLDVWICYFFRYIVAFVFFFLFYYDTLPDVDILTKDIMLMFMWLPVPAPFVFYVMLFAPGEDPSIIASLSALTQITQVLIFCFLGTFYFNDLGAIDDDAQ